MDSGRRVRDEGVYNSAVPRAYANLNLGLQTRWNFLQNQLVIRRDQPNSHRKMRDFHGMFLKICPISQKIYRRS